MTNRKGNSRKGRTKVKGNPDIIKTVAAGKASGKGIVQIAKETGISKSTVHRIATADETKALIEQTAQTLIHNGMETAVINMLDTLDQSKALGVKPDDAKMTVRDKQGFKADTVDKDLLKHMMDLRKESNRVSEGILKSVGLLPAHAPAIHIQAIININESNTLAPTVRGVVEHYTDDLVIDAEYSDDG